MKTKATDAATTWAFRTGWRVVQRMPERAARRMFDAIADRTWAKRGPSVRQLERNLARAVPDATPADLRDLSRAAMRSYMRYWMEAFQLPSWSPRRILSTFHMYDADLLDESVEAGKGVMIVGAHLGNWDHAGAWGALRYGSVVSVAERLEPAAVFDEFVAYRNTIGITVHGLGDDGVVMSLARALRDGEIVALVGDRDISRNGVVVDLLGEPASLPAGPALLALMSGAPLHTFSVWYEDGRTCGRIGPPIPVPDGLPREEQIRVMTQAVADSLGDAIRAHPVDWHMLQPLWLADLDDDRLDDERRAIARAARAQGAPAGEGGR